MGREIESVSDAVELLKSLYEHPQPRIEKWKTLYNLAQRSTGNIVELGTWWGSGAIALALGSRKDQTVYTIDDYLGRSGWAGETYDKSDEELFYFFVDKAEEKTKTDLKIRLIKDNAIDGWLNWNFKGIGLLFWDLGCENILGESMFGWVNHIQSGGIVAIHDTYSNLFGANQYLLNLVDVGNFCQYEIMPGGMHVAVKK